MLPNGPFKDNLEFFVVETKWIKKFLLKKQIFHGGLIEFDTTQDLKMTHIGHLEF